MKEIFTGKEFTKAIIDEKNKIIYIDSNILFTWSLFWIKYAMHKMEIKEIRITNEIYNNEKIPIKSTNNITVTHKEIKILT